MSDAPPSAQEADWYDDFYKASQRMGCWHYFLLPHLRGVLRPEARLLELGCGRGHVLQYLIEKKLVQPERLWAIDQSRTAVEQAARGAPGAHVAVGDIYRLEFPENFFQVCLLMETIEHLEEPDHALRGMASVLAPGGWLYLSFPNYLRPDWLALRLLSDLLNKPQWIVRQPIDKIYTVSQVRRRVRRCGLDFITGIGSGYFPPKIYPWETEGFTRSLNRLGLWWASFHPILVFRKPSASASS